MEAFKFFLFILLFPKLLMSQTVSGIIYDNSSKLSGVNITNLTNGTTTYSDEQGLFNIVAKENDSISFDSPNHEPLIIPIENKHLTGKQTIVLNKKVLELEAVELTEKFIPKAFDVTEYNNNITTQLKEDMKRNPAKYGIVDNTISIAGLVSLIGKLLQKKKSNPQKSISFQSLDSLFNANNIFNDELLTKNLGVKPEHKNLFLYYCESRSINANLLQEDNHFSLLDKLIEISSTYKEYIIVEEKR